MIFAPDAMATLRDSIAAARPLTGPLDVQIIPTTRCNASCAFCPLCAIPKRHLHQTPRFDPAQPDLSGGLLDRLADDLYYLGGLRRLTITGGEPLLYPFVIPAIFQFSRNFPKAQLSLVTNGIRLAKFASFLVFAGVHDVHVSINAGTTASCQAQNPGAGPDTFDQILSGITALTDARHKSNRNTPRVTLSVVLTKHSAPDVADLFEIGRRTRVDAVTYIPLMALRLPIGVLNQDLQVSAEQFQTFKDSIRHFGDMARAEGFYLGYADAYEHDGVITSGDLYRNQPCFQGYSFAAIYPNGDVRPCCHCEPVMGNLTRQSFADIWRSEKYQSQRERMMAIQERGSLDGCLCRECGHCFENEEAGRGLGFGV
jgi:MoaA/NifB/PqqE/SkfB family radical SAM enzyme